MKTRSRKMMRWDDGVFLTDEFLNTTIANAIYGHRIFYVLSMQSHPGVFKFGVAHASEGKMKQPLNRLRSYTNAHGFPDETNPASGVKIHYLEYTKVSGIIERSKSRIARLETRIKRVMKKSGELDLDRGTERTFPGVPLSRIIALVDRDFRKDERIRIRKRHSRKCKKRKRS